MISFADFQKVEMKVGEILSVEKVEGKDKLYKMQVGLGSGPVQVVAGLAPFYTEGELRGRKAIFVTNLEPAKIGGKMSNAMILAAENEDETVVAFISPEKDMANGAKVL